MATTEPQGSTKATQLSVVLCTLNPRAEVLSWVLEGVRNQSVPSDQFEVIIVDNQSRPPVDPESWSRWGLNLRIVSEQEPGQITARVRGIAEAKSPYLLFLDDDTRPSSNYFEAALAAIAREPRIGCFGGATHGRFEAPPPAWAKPLLPYLAVRDCGPESLQNFEDVTVPFEPIGAGMVVRQDVAEYYADWLARDTSLRQLGRRGEDLLSGDDSLMARSSYKLGFGCAYEPTLRMEHWVRANRFAPSYLRQLMLGHGRSYVRVEVLCTGGLAKPTWVRGIVTLAGALLNRLRHSGVRGGWIEWHYDWGRLLELKGL
ncbi:MAG: glycosyltransferase [Bryobacteraceae bacterium]